MMGQSGGNSSSLSGDEWKADLQSSIQMYEQTLADPDMPSLGKGEIINQIAISKYSLENNIPPLRNTMWGGVKESAGLIMLVTLFTVIIAGDMVAGEFTWGTIKLLLIRPASRAKVLLSKYLSTLLFSLLLLLVLLVSAVLFNCFGDGFKDIGLPYLHATSEGVVKESNVLLHILNTYALKLVELIMVVTLAFMISTVFRSSSLAIGISIFIMFAGQGITALLVLKYSWAKYFLFANTDLTQHLEGRPVMEGMTMGFSITVLLVYFIIFNVLSWIIFKKRDVAA